MQSVLIINFTSFYFIGLQLNTPSIIYAPVSYLLLLSNYCGIKLSELSCILARNSDMSEKSVVLYPNFSAIEQHCDCIQNTLSDQHTEADLRLEEGQMLQRTQFRRTRK